MTAPIVSFAGAAALSILSIGGLRERAQLRSLGGDSCTNAAAAADSSLVTFRAAVPPRVAAGQPIPISLTLANHSDRRVSMSATKRLAGIGFDIEITRVSDGAHVWNRFGGIFVWIDVGPIVDTLAAGDSVVYADRWTQKMNNGQFATPGAYCVRGLIDAEPLDGRPHKRLFTSEAASVTIVAEDK